MFRKFILFSVLGRMPAFVSSIGSVVTEGVEGNKDKTPVIGAGYSPSTQRVLGACLRVDGTSEPSFDYNYDFTFFTSSSSVDGDIGDESFAAQFNQKNKFLWDPDVMAVMMSDRSGTKLNINYFLSEMKADMYYNSVDYSKSQISSAALSILMKRDYIGFLQACGPYYIRSVRRLKALVTLFRYTSTSSNPEESVSTKLFNSIAGIGESGDETAASLEEVLAGRTLTINIFGYGLTMEESSGVGSLLATSLDDYEDVQNYAFNAMKDTKSGLVQAIEIFPWVSNMQFQMGSGIEADTTYERCYSVTARSCTGKRCMLSNEGVVGRNATNEGVVGRNATNCNSICYSEDNVAYNCDDGVFCTALIENGICYRYRATVETDNLTAVATSEFEYEDVVNANCIDNRLTFAIEHPEFMEVSTRNQVLCTAAKIGTTLRENYENEFVTFPRSLKLFNFMSNAELLANADATVREGFNLIESMGQCIGILSAYSPDTLQRTFVRNKLREVSSALYSEALVSDPAAVSISTGITDFSSPLRASRLLLLLKGDRCANAETCSLCSTEELDDLTSNRDGSTEALCVARGKRYLYSRQVNEFLAYVQGFYAPCLNALSMNDANFMSGTLFTRHWTQLDSCKKPTCLIRGSRYLDSIDTCWIQDSSVNRNSGSLVQDTSYLVASFCMPIFRGDNNSE